MKIKDLIEKIDDIKHIFINGKQYDEIYQRIYLKDR